MGELRVHGIGGTTATSMLDAAPAASLVPRWPRTSPAYLWTADDPSVSAYHWARLTSGSKWFVLWPLLLPFTLLNVAGFMHPVGAVGRGLERLHQLLCVVATVWFAAWVTFAGQTVAAAKGWSAGVGVSMSAAVVVIVLGSSFRRCSWKDGEAPRRPGARRGSLADAQMFHAGQGLWGLHVLVLLGTAILIWRPDENRGAGDLGQASGNVVIDAGIVLVALLWILVVGAVLARLGTSSAHQEPWAWTFRAAGTSCLGAAFIGGLGMTLLRVVVGGDQLRGAPFVLFDVYGWAVLVAIGVGLASATVILLRRAPGERVVGYASHLLPNPSSWLRARVALLPRAGVAAGGAAAITFVVLGTVQFARRAPASVDRWLDLIGVDRSTQRADALREAMFAPGSPATVRLTHLAIYGLFTTMFLNLLRSRGATDSLRRIGSLWDVVTFWPRAFHPFAVRPYTESAVDQLRELLFVDLDGEWEAPVVVAHSQGSMLVLAALAPGQAPGAEVESASRVSHLVTAGCPLRSLYMKAFPRYVDEALVEQVSQALSGERRWTNVFRFTDHVGRSAFSDEEGWAPDAVLPGGTVDRWTRQSPTPSGVIRVDCALADPESRQGSIAGHNDYWSDRRMREVVQG